MVDMSDNHSCPSAVLVVFRKEQQPPAMVRCYYASYFVLLRVRLAWLWLGANIYVLILIKILGFLLGFPVGVRRYYVWCSALIYVSLTWPD